MSEVIKFISSDFTREASLSVTSDAAGYDIDNVALTNKSKTWRSTSLATQTITLTWGSAKVISGCALCLNNLIVGSTYQVRVYTNSGDGSPVFSTSVQNVTFAYDVPTNETTIGSDSFQRGGGNYCSIFFDEQSVEKVEVVLTSSGNPDGYMEISKLVVGTATEIQGGADFGSAVSMVGTGDASRHESTQLMMTRGSQFKAVRINRELLGPTSRQSLDVIVKSFGHGYPLFVSVMDEDGSDEQKISFQVYGFISNNNTMSMMVYNHVSTLIEISEI